MSADRDTIDAVAAVLASVPSRIYRRETRYDGPEHDRVFSAEEMRRRYAEALLAAGWLRTPEDRAVLDALYAKEMAFRRYQPVRDSATEITDELRSTGEAFTLASHAFDDVADTYVARRVAAGGTVPADLPEAQP
jgi:hypothetical protein